MDKQSVNFLTRITSFFSYKGGVGRTAILARIAREINSLFDRRICCVDLDLESPGFGPFFKDELVGFSILSSLINEDYDSLQREVVNDISAISTSSNQLDPAYLEEIIVLFDTNLEKMTLSARLRELIVKVCHPNRYQHLLIDNRTGLISRMGQVFEISHNIVFVFRADQQNENILRDIFVTYIQKLLLLNKRIAVVISMYPEPDPYNNLELFLDRSGLNSIKKTRQFGLFKIPLYPFALYNEEKILTWTYPEFTAIAKFLEGESND
jgi:cellulose biosynthesis protein BcsQ